MNTKVLHNLTCGLYVLSSRSGEKRSGCIINTVMQVTSRPLRITITVNKANYTHDLIAQSRCIHRFPAGSVCPLRSIPALWLPERPGCG